MATDFYLNPETGDLDLTGNVSRRTLTYSELARQQVTITLNAFRGEWIFNILFGVPYLANDNNTVQLLGKTEKRVVDAALQEAIINVETISEILSYESRVDGATRTLLVSFQARVIEGDLITFVDFPVPA